MLNNRFCSSERGEEKDGKGKRMVGTTKTVGFLSLAILFPLLIFYFQ
jgi:hypothetical protein